MLLRMMSVNWGGVASCWGGSGGEESGWGDLRLDGWCSWWRGRLEGEGEEKRDLRLRDSAAALLRAMWARWASVRSRLGPGGLVGVVLGVLGVCCGCGRKGCGWWCEVGGV